MAKWHKHIYICTNCDALYEITIKSNKSPNPHCTEDDTFLTLLSVKDVTLEPSNQHKEKDGEICLMCNENKEDNGLIVCSKCNESEGKL